MNQLPDVRRIGILHGIRAGFSLRDMQRTGTCNKGTVIRFVEIAHSLLVTSGFHLREEYRHRDWRTRKRLPLNGRTRKASAWRAGLPVTYLRAAFAQADADGTADVIAGMLVGIARKAPRYPPKDESRRWRKRAMLLRNRQVTHPLSGEAQWLERSRTLLVAARRLLAGELSPREVSDLQSETFALVSTSLT